MGIVKIGSASSYDKKYYASCDCTQPNLPNPNPNNYKIIKSKQYGDYLVILINYPDCKNYEGDKILLYKNTNLKSLRKQRMIDPHFSENINFHSPIARFAPTNDGWTMAETLAMIMNNFGKTDPLRNYE